MYFRNDQYSNFYQNNFSPFNVARSPSKDIFYTPRKTPTLRSTISSAEKGIDTISSLIPLCQKAIPLITTGKDFLNNVKTKFLKKDTSKKSNEKVEVEIMPLNKDNNDNNDNTNKYRKEETGPNKPFF